MGNTRFYVDVRALHKEVTGSCILNEIKFPDGSTKRVLVDCGLFHEVDAFEYNKTFPFDAKDIDYVLVTHNHIDHTGRLPMLIKSGYNGNIHMSYSTSKLISNALEDSYKVLKNKCKMLNEPLLYTDTDVHQTVKKVKGHPFEESIWLDDNIKITLFKNGHLPGATCILMQVKYRDGTHQYYEDINILYTGDYNNKNVFFDVEPIPKWVHQLPVIIIQEATYGNMDSSEIKPVFENNLLNAIKNGKEVIVPVFSLGRSQEILYLLKKLQDDSKLSKDIPIYYDGKLGNRYTTIYSVDGLDNKEECKDFLPENYTVVSDSETRSSIIDDGQTKIILTTSGMGSHGPAQTYLPIYLRRPNALIHFTGYVAEGTLGRRLYDCVKEDIVEVAGLQVKKLADVEFTNEFSAHAKADELVDFLRPFENIKLVLINHGEPLQKKVYANRVVKEIEPKDVGILGDYGFRLDGYGFMKPLTSTIE